MPPQVPTDIAYVFLRIQSLSQLIPNPDLPNIQAYQVLRLFPGGHHGT